MKFLKIGILFAKIFVKRPSKETNLDRIQKNFVFFMPYWNMTPNLRSKKVNRLKYSTELQQNFNWT